MPFTKENKPLLEEAASIDFQFMKTGRINHHKHGPYERGLFFIKQVVEKYGNRYGYSKVIYKNNSTKVIITCEQHGDFEQLSSNHLRGSTCPKCSDTYSPTTEEFKERAKSVHGNKYDYTTSKYSGMHEKLEIKCPVHGLFYLSPANHIHNVQGCPKCGGTYPLTTEEFIARARDTHGEKYSYESVCYKNSQEKVEIICPLHGSFFQSPAGHTHGGEGCPACAGKNHNILYLLKCNETGWYKIGITTDNVQKRVTSIGGNIEEVHCVKLTDPRKHEAILHKRYEKDREYNLCVKSGNTEFFSLTEEQVKEVIDYMNEVSDG